MLENIGKRIDTVDNKVTFIQRKYKRDYRLETEMTETADKSVRLNAINNEYTAAGSVYNTQAL